MKSAALLLLLLLFFGGQNSYRVEASTSAEDSTSAEASASSDSATPSVESLNQEERLRRFNTQEDKGSLNINLLTQYRPENWRGEGGTRTPAIRSDQALHAEVRRYLRENLLSIVAEPDQAHVLSFRSDPGNRGHRDRWPAGASIRLRRVINGYPVSGSDYVKIWFDIETGKVNEVRGGFTDTSEQDLRPTVDKLAAVSIAIEALDAPNGITSQALMHYYLQSGKLRPIWRVSVRVDPLSIHSTKTVSIDGYSGEVRGVSDGNVHSKVAPIAPNESLHQE
jgi:hypothetical protein